ncbi:hypothetical protein IWX75_000575 [Arthrobacter sp. CAN_A6]|uniref:hypothetical protein n=1 Tax=Arthrobacter sp. CAN_A6 TaxID=2787721 RepID=UPI0018CA1AE6
MTKQQVEHDTGGTGGSTANPADARTGSGEHLEQEHRPSGPFGPSDAVVGPFTLRETVFGGAVLLVFIGTLIPFARDTISYQNFWTISPLFYVGLGILLPVAAAALLASRRLGTATLRVGSLSVDQFASVSAVLASVFFFLETVTFFQAGALVSLIGALGMLVATVLAPHLPPLNKDFKERPDSGAHLVARPVLAARPKPPRQPKESKEPKPVPAEQVEQWTEVPPGGTVRSDAVRPADTRPDKSQPAKQYGEKVAGLLGRIRPGTGQQASKQGSVPRPEGRSATAAGATAAGATAAGASSSASATGASSVSVAGAKSSTPAGSKPDTSTPSTESSDPVESGTPVSDTAVCGTVTPDAGGSKPVRTEPGSTEEEVGGAEPSPDGVATETRTPLAETRAHTVISESSPAVRQDPISATRDPEEEQVVEAFWFAVGTPKVVVDEHTGRAIFTLEPGDWEVGIEDRGSEFLVQDKRTGHVGVMRDLSNIERAPKD